MEPRPDLMRFVALDLLRMDGHDLTAMTLEERRDLLKDLVTSARDLIRFSESFNGTGSSSSARSTGWGWRG